MTRAKARISRDHFEKYPFVCWGCWGYVCRQRPPREQLWGQGGPSHIFGVRSSHCFTSPNPQLLCQVVFQSSTTAFAVVLAAAFVVRRRLGGQRGTALGAAATRLFSSAFDASTSSSRAQDFEQSKLDSDQHSIKNVLASSLQITVSSFRFPPSFASKTTHYYRPSFPDPFFVKV